MQHVKSTHSQSIIHPPSNIAILNNTSVMKTFIRRRMQVLVYHVKEQNSKLLFRANAQPPNSVDEKPNGM